MSEEELIDVFKVAGEVVGFRYTAIHSLYPVLNLFS
jgi:hypothetical protein